jgi:hypothetical protein
MRDPTGENWLAHFLHGTCTMLRLQDPKTLTSPGVHTKQKQTFFLATRIFEIARSLIYSSPSFLSKPEWTDALAKLWESVDPTLWHPKEALFDILPRVADLSIRALHFCETVAQVSADTRYELIRSLAAEGQHLRQLLQQWWSEATTWEQLSLDQDNSYTMRNKTDNELLIGYAYYHAISIYLSGTFDYYPHWHLPSSPLAPMLPRSTIDWHVSEVLRISQELLSYGVSGVLLFFPLRVAGARADDARSREGILNHLQVTHRRGFVVAESFVTDLEELWANRDM